VARGFITRKKVN
jgi:hypothetical protein